MLNKGMFTSNTDMWETPQELFDELDREFHFTLDVCAVPENAKCKRYFTPAQNGLKQDWNTGGGTVYMTPPHTVGKSVYGCVKRQSVASRRFVCCLRGRTRRGFTTTYTARRRSALSGED